MNYFSNSEEYDMEYSNVQEKADKLSKYALVISLVSLCCCGGGLFSIISLIMSIFCLADSYCSTKGRAVAALVISIISMLSVFVVLVSKINTESDVTTSNSEISQEYNDSSSTSEVVQKSNEESKSVNKSKSKSNKQSSNKDYQIVSIKTLLDTLDSNALKAEKTYQDKYVQFTGYISNIDSDGAYISVTATNDQWDFNSLHCSITDDSQLDVIIERSVGDEVTIKGQITDIGEVVGYYVDIHSIK